MGFAAAPKIKKTALLVFFVLIFPTATYGEKETVVGLSSRNSGYDGTKDDWISFLSCWRDESKKLPNYDEGYLLRFSDKSRTLKKLSPISLSGIELPKSLVDFHAAYLELGGEYRNEENEGGIGLFSPGDIQTLSTYSYDLIAVKNEWPDESDDSEYFRYGIKQDNAAVRTSYQNNAIVVGQYGFSEYELIVLYPDSTTEDGEMETAIFAHASEARTPSFAEMMRQLSYFFTKSPDSTPIYSQQEINKSCASRLPLKNIWWE